MMKNFKTKIRTITIDLYRNIAISCFISIGTILINKINICSSSSRTSCVKFYSTYSHSLPLCGKERELGAEGKNCKQEVASQPNSELEFSSGLLNFTGIKLAPQWVTGIIDSEGNFSILVQKTSKGYKISLAFKVTQKEHSKGILLYLQKYFECGKIHIDNKKENGYKFSVNRLEDILTKIIPHIDKYPLLTSKYLDYLDFKQVALLMQNKLHLNKEVKDNILVIKNNMNSLRSFETRWNHLNNSYPIKLSSEWVQAFIDGEGSFQFSIVNTKNRGKPYLALSPTLEVAQSSHDVLILKAIIEFFGVGYLKPKFDIFNMEAAKISRNVNRLVINQHSVIIDFFEKYPLFTRKYFDYLDWKKLIKLKSERAQDTEEGLQLMKDIKSGMNRGRNK